MSDMDMTAVIQPKSDQLNADDLIGGPITIRIRDVRIAGGQEQPVSIFYDGDNGKPYKPCKSMSRVLVQAWGRHAAEYVGKWVTLYRDPSVRYGGMEVGGIRISHMSDIPHEKTFALTVTKAKRAPFRVLPLVPPQGDAPAVTLENARNQTEFFAALAARLAPGCSREDVEAVIGHERVQAAQKKLTGETLEKLNALIKAALDRTAQGEDVA